MHPPEAPGYFFFALWWVRKTLSSPLMCGQSSRSSRLRTNKRRPSFLDPPPPAHTVGGRDPRTGMCTKCLQALRRFVPTPGTRTGEEKDPITHMPQALCIWLTRPAFQDHDVPEPIRWRVLPIVVVAGTGRSTSTMGNDKDRTERGAADKHMLELRQGTLQLPMAQHIKRQIGSGHKKVPTLLPPLPFNGGRAPRVPPGNTRAAGVEPP